MLHLKKLTISLLLLGLAASAFGKSRNRRAEPSDRVLRYAADPESLHRSLAMQDRLLSLAESYAKKRYVPYIWGGGIVGNKKSCLACRRCVRQRAIPLKQRLQQCQPCRRCGLDCSHFINRLYREAGLTYDYASTWELSRQSNAGLLKHYNFVNIGNNLAVAQRGDLLVYKRHIVMLSRVISDTHADFVHVTRFRPGDRFNLGGFRWDKNRNAKSFRGRLVRILRHKSFFGAAEELSAHQQAPTEFPSIRSFFASL